MYYTVEAFSEDNIRFIGRASSPFEVAEIVSSATAKEGEKIMVCVHDEEEIDRVPADEFV